MRREIIRQDCIAPITPWTFVDGKAVFPLVFLQDTCQPKQFTALKSIVITYIVSLCINQTNPANKPEEIEIETEFV